MTTGVERSIGKRTLGFGAITLVVFVALPLLATEYPISLLTDALIFSIYALGINLLLGQLGYVSFGHAMFLGVSGYVYAYLTMFHGWSAAPGMVVSIAGCGLVGLFIGLICMRVSRVQFILITLAFGEMTHGILVKLNFMGGTDGIAGLPRPDLTALNIDMWETTSFYYYVLSAFVAIFLLVLRLSSSPFGQSMDGIRENEDRMTACGYNIAIYKYSVFALSGVMCGVAGILLAQKNSFVSPEVVSWTISGEGLLMVIIGGASSLTGPVFGAFFFILLKDVLSVVTHEYLTVFGLIFVFIVVFFRQGISGLFRSIAPQGVRK